MLEIAQSRPVGRPRSRALLRLAAALCVIALSFGALGCAGNGGSPPADAASAEGSAGTAGGQEESSGKLEPRYQPREPEPKPWYNTAYLFGMTRGVTNSTIHPAAQVPLLVLTIPLDIVFLPFAAIGGFF